MMYWINKQDDGKYQTVLESVHDKTSYTSSNYPTLADAIKALKHEADFINDHVITMIDITYCSNCYKEAIPLRELDDSPVKVMERVLGKLPKQYQEPRMYFHSTDPERNFIYQSARYLPKVLQLVKELEMVIHDLQEESQAAREALKYRKRVEKYEKVILEACEKLHNAQFYPNDNSRTDIVILLESALIGER